MSLLDPLAMSPVDVARLSPTEREERVRALMAEAHGLVDLGIRKFITDDRREVAATVILFSGGNDSTVLAHLMRGRATHAAHANTGIGVEETRRFVRETCAAWGLPLLERGAATYGDSYRALVLDQGFPGPGHHFKMFQRLKERAIRRVVAELVGDPRKRRVVLLAGRRRTESERRASVPEFERDRSKVWISPLVNWTKPDLATYGRMMGDVPQNSVSALIHMSGECLCGSFSHVGERAEIEAWFPEAFAEVAELERLIANDDRIQAHRRVWGWGSDPMNARFLRRARTTVGRLCGARCDPRQLAMPFVAGGAS